MMRFLTIPAYLTLASVLSTTAYADVAQKTLTTAAPTTQAKAAPSVTATPSKSIPYWAIPAGTVKGTVKAMLGYTSGYIDPEAGQEFVLDILPPEKTHPSLVFLGKGAYIPFPKPFSVVQVNPKPSSNMGPWSSFRAIYQDKEGGRKVTLDASRYSVLGHPDNVIVWVLIENHNQIVGMAQLQGLLTPPPQK